jgi:ribose transport system permease protein
MPQVMARSAAPALEDAVEGRPPRLRVPAPLSTNAGVLAIVWAALVLATAIDKSTFLSYDTLLSVAFQMATVGVLGVGAAVVMLSGGLADLSIPASTGLASCITASAVTHMASAPAIALGVGAGIAFGLVNGLLITLLRLNPLVTTIGTNFVGQGILNLGFSLAIVPTHSGVRQLGVERFAGMPTQWWVMVLLLVLTSAALAFTRYGRRVRLVGGSPVAARRGGISLRKTRICTFAFMGLCAGIAGVFFAAQAQNVTPLGTQDLLFPALTAVIVSGFALRGGTGQLPTLFLGLGFLATVPASLVFFGLSSEWQAVWQGALLAMVVGIDGARRKRASR